MHVLANSAALERKEVSGVSESSPHLERHLGHRNDTDTDCSLALNKQPEMYAWVMLWFPHVVQCQSFSSNSVWVIVFCYCLVFTKKVHTHKEHVFLFVSVEVHICLVVCVLNVTVGQMLQNVLTLKHRMCWLVLHSSTACNHNINSHFCSPGQFVCGPTCLLLVEFPLNLLVVTGVVDDGPGQLRLDVWQPWTQATHVFF